MKLRYLVVYERMPNNYCAGAPDVPGCFSTARTWKKMQKMVVEALEFHLDDLVETGQPIPEPRMSMLDAVANYSAEESSEEDYGYSQFNDAPEPLEITFGWVEVNVPDYVVDENPATTSRVADEA